LSLIKFNVLCGLLDLTGAGLSIKSNTMQILPVWIVIGVIYRVCITEFSKIMNKIYEKKKIPVVELMIQ
jgi:ABC-type amino acid transport system permease subunit